MRCAECGAELRRTTEPIVESYKGEIISVDGIEHMQCDSCGYYELSLEDADRLSSAIADEYAHRMGLLSPADIRGLRKALGMSQREFEKMIGVSSPTASRWETGAVQQSKPVDNLMRILRDVPEARSLLMERTVSKFQSRSYQSDIETSIHRNGGNVAPHNGGYGKILEFKRTKSGFESTIGAKEA